jgi:hypothetical protein
MEDIMQRRILLACTLVCCLGAVAIWSDHARAAQSTSALVGSWQLTLVPNLPPTDPPTIPVAGLATFTSDETVVATAGGVIVGPFSSTGAVTNGVTPAHGIWQPSPAVGRFFIKLIGLVTNPNGSLAATRTFTATVLPGAAGDSFSGSYTLEIVEGNIVVISTGTVTGKLIPHPLLP